MTKQRLEKYRRLEQEIKRHEASLAKLNNPTLHDTVQSSDGPGNTQREISVYSGGKCKTERQYERLKRRAEKERDAIVAFIESEEDAEMRLIMYYRFIEKTEDKKLLSWQAVAFHMGWTDESTPRQKFNDYFQSRISPKKLC